jgi:hypothetical protein
VFDTCALVTGISDPPRAVDAVAGFAILRPAFPNPLTPRTRIGFDLMRAGPVTLTMRDVSGRKVAVLLDRDLEAGSHSVTWDARDASGARVRSGVYFYELASGGQRLSRRLIVVR